MVVVSGAAVVVVSGAAMVVVVVSCTVVVGAEVVGGAIVVVVSGTVVDVTMDDVVVDSCGPWPSSASDPHAAAAKANTMMPTEVLNFIATTRPVLFDAYELNPRPTSGVSLVKETSS